MPAAWWRVFPDILSPLADQPWEFITLTARSSVFLVSMWEDGWQSEVMFYGTVLTYLAITSLFSHLAISYRMTAQRECSSGSSQASRLIKAGMPPASTRACTTLTWVEILLNSPTVLHCSFILGHFNRLIKAGMVPVKIRLRWTSMSQSYLPSIYPNSNEILFMVGQSK